MHCTPYGILLLFDIKQLFYYTFIGYFNNMIEFLFY